MNEAFIAVLDSGIGGLAFLKKAATVFPNENFLYFGDVANFPYGDKSKAQIVSYALKALEFVAHYKAKALILACNTLEAQALEVIKKEFDGVVVSPIRLAVELALSISQKKAIGVIGTEGTINSQVYQRQLGSVTSVWALACPSLAPLVEQGIRTSERSVIEQVLCPLKVAPIDTLVLGCTHYSVLAQQIVEYWKGAINIVDPCWGMVYRLKELLIRTSQISREKKGQRLLHFSAPVPYLSSISIQGGFQCV